MAGSSARIGWAALLCGGLAGCGSAPIAVPSPPVRATPALPNPPPAPDPEANRVPTPYTTAQIRGASPEGRSYEFLVERPDRPAVRRKLVFIAVSDERATISSSELDPTGQKQVAGEMLDQTWEELRMHASFPKAVTTVDEDRSETPVGVFDCLRYTIVEQTPEGPARTVLWFAKELPGPPVETLLERGGQTIERTMLLRYEPGIR
jgi:hypothetical protein